ncbi:cytochrome oxidase small assembly protein [Herbaspirillum sp. DW155]|nr:cytochrome oxidase small assembly protein [Herbaspirillum sp. DW155]
MTERKKPNNLRTGLLLGMVALAFFVGIFINRIWFAQ